MFYIIIFIIPPFISSQKRKGTLKDVLLMRIKRSQYPKILEQQFTSYNFFFQILVLFEERDKFMEQMNKGKYYKLRKFNNIQICSVLRHL